MMNEENKNIENENVDQPKPAENVPVEEQAQEPVQEPSQVNEQPEENVEVPVKPAVEQVDVPAREEPSPVEKVEPSSDTNAEEPSKVDDTQVQDQPESPEEKVDVPVDPAVEPAQVQEPVEEQPPIGDASEVVPEEEVSEKPKGEAKWYVIQTFTGQEEKVKQAIEFTVSSEHLKDKVFQVLVPTEELVEIKGGKRVVKVKKMFPGYVFLEMILDEESWYLIRQTVGVARFIGTKVKPTPVSGKEMQRVLKQLGREERLEITFEKGEGVRVISGPFRGYTGTVDEVSPEKGKLKILINIFGRDTPVEVNFEHAQKIV